MSSLTPIIIQAIKRKKGIITVTTKSALPEAARSRLGTGARLMVAIPGWMAVCAAAGAVGGAAYRAISPSKRLRGPSEGESASPPHSAPDECDDGQEEVEGGEKSTDGRGRKGGEGGK